MAVAAWQEWAATDLVWSLWISSLLVGYAFIVLNLFAGTTSGGSLPSAFRIPAALFGLAFFTIHFGGFHFVHSIFLDEFFPMAAGSGGSTFAKPSPLWWADIIAEAVERYWPFLLATAVSRRGAFAEGIAAAPEAKTSMGGPYRNVVRMHVLIFVFAGLEAAGMSGYAVYPVLFFYFFPLGAVKRMVERWVTQNA